jgi:putative ABC transport system ATP-binding protein
LLLQTARAQGATLVIATHDARVAAFLVDQNNGQIGLQRLSLVRKQLLKEEQKGDVAATPSTGAAP